MRVKVLRRATHDEMGLVSRRSDLIVDACYYWTDQMDSLIGGIYKVLDHNPSSFRIRTKLGKIRLPRCVCEIVVTRPE